MRIIQINITGERVDDFIAAGKEDLERDILPEKLGVKSNDIEVNLTLPDNIYYRIWSFEHNAWWVDNGRGYTQKFEEAGHFSRRKAAEVCIAANRYQPKDRPNESMIPFEK